MSDESGDILGCFSGGGVEHGLDDAVSRDLSQPYSSISVVLEY